MKSYCEKLAISTAQLFFQYTHESLDTILLLHKVPFYNQNILSLAYNCNCRSFMAQPGVQNVLDKIWRNKFTNETSSLRLLDFDFLYYYRLIRYYAKVNIE